LHPSPRIEWIDDSLPDLPVVSARAETFDLVMLTAVWMHLDTQHRQRGMPRVAALVRPGGVLLMTLRHGPVPAGRRMFDVMPEATVDLAQQSGLSCIQCWQNSDSVLKRPSITWDRLAFAKA
jgi:SAM-dependent methyltransferase